MPNQSLNLPPQTTRKHSAEEINRAMTRFPFLVEILGELDRNTVPFPGDDDLRHGCERALTAMLSELARLGPAPAGKPTQAEEMALSWLENPEARKLIDADKMERMQQFIDSILGPRDS